MNYIDENFRYTNSSEYDKRIQKPIEKYVNDLWKPILSKYLNKYVEEGSTVCDLGAGTFEHVQYMQKAEKIYVVEINEKMINAGIEKTLKLKEKLNILKEDALRTSIPNESCDIIWSVGLSEFVDLGKLFSELARICKNNGTILIQFPNLLNPYNLASSIIYKILNRPIKDYRTIYQFRRFSKANNLKIEEFVSTGIFFYVPEKLQKYFIALWKIINYFYAPFQKYLPLGANIFCVIRKR